MSQTRGELVTLIRSARTWAVLCALAVVGFVCWHLIGPYRVTIPPEALPWPIELSVDRLNAPDMVKVGRDGTVLLFRRSKQNWRAYQSATLKLSPQRIEALLDLVDQEPLGVPEPPVVNEIHDFGHGLSLVLRRDGKHGEKVAEYSEPDRKYITRVAAVIDRFLQDNGLAEARWYRVPLSDVFDQENNPVAEVCP